MPAAFIIEMSKLKVPREYQSDLPNHTGADAVYSTYDLADVRSGCKCRPSGRS